MEKEKRRALKGGLLKRMQDFDKLIDDDNDFDSIVIERSSIRAQILQPEKKEVYDMSQKAKIRWSIDGDGNSKYFHGV